MTYFCQLSRRLREPRLAAARNATGGASLIWACVFLGLALMGITAAPEAHASSVSAADRLASQKTPAPPAKQATDLLAHEALTSAQQRLRRTIQLLGKSTAYPRSAEDEEWRIEDARDWTSGFFPGLLWQMYEYTGEEYWQQKARA